MAAKPGKAHQCEPDGDGSENLLAGHLWEQDMYTDAPDDPLPTVADLLDTLTAEGVNVAAIRARWEAEGKPSPWDGGAPFITEAAEAARLAGFDVYESDTRTWVYREPVECDSCESGECTKRDAHAKVLEPLSFGLGEVPFEVPCQRNGCPGVVAGKVRLQALQWDEPAEYPDTFECTTCRHSYAAAFMVQHQEVCTGADGLEMSEEEADCEHLDTNDTRPDGSETCTDCGKEA